MFDCATDVVAYHNDEVTLKQSDRTNMRDRRDVNRTRIKNGLKAQSKPAPKRFVSQGSYAMLTMVQQPGNDYDIDDGCYFAADDLVTSTGAAMSPLDVRKMVRDAVDDGSFKKKPEVRKNCVRVYYDAGYHVDIACYRVTVLTDATGSDIKIYELAGPSWRQSDARAVTEWFDEENQSQSPDEDNGRQLRRVTRNLKKFARSRESWCDSTASGVTISKLVTECYQPDAERDDVALHDTMKAIHDRLLSDLEVNHPVNVGDKLTKGKDDARTKFLRSKLANALADLDVLFENTCTRTKALAAWDKVYNTTFFSDRDDAKTAKSASASITTASMLKRDTADEALRAPVQKHGGQRYA
jgi:hypothetical protein